MAVRWVHRHGNGWRGRVIVRGVTFTGPVRTTPEDAHQDALSLREAAAAPRSRLTLAEGMEMVRASLKRRQRRSGTREFYECQFAALLKHWRPGIPLIALNRPGIERFVSARLASGVSVSTVRHHLRALGRIYRLAMAAGMLSSDPTRRIDLPDSREPRRDEFTQAEIRELLARVIHPEDRDLFEFMAKTGLRRSEVARMDASDVGEELLVQGKRRQRVIPLSDHLRELGRRVAFRRLTAEQIARRFQRWQRKLGEPRWHAHALRHSFASELARRGIGFGVLASLLGHAPGSAAITMRYIHARNPEKAAAMALFD